MRLPSRRRLLLALPAIAYAALILFLSSRPGSQIPSIGIAYGDKVLHVAEYFLYGLLLLYPTRDLGWRGRVLSLAVGLAYAAFDEAFQTGVPGRAGDVFDWAADAVGLAVAVALDGLVRARIAAKTA